jgi:hypothetical protein
MPRLTLVISVIIDIITFSGFKFCENFKISKRTVHTYVIREHRPGFFREKKINEHIRLLESQEYLQFFSLILKVT